MTFTQGYDACFLLLKAGALWLLLRIVLSAMPPIVSHILRTIWDVLTLNVVQGSMRIYKDGYGYDRFEYLRKRG